MPRVWKWIALVALILVAGRDVRADVVLVTSEAALGPDDSIDWGQLGDDGAFLASSESVTSVGGILAVVSTTDSTGMQRLDEGGPFYFGNFNIGDKLITSLDINYYPIKIQFSTPISGVGAQINQDASGPFIATIEAFAGSTSLGVLQLAGESTSDQDGSAIFIGVSDTTREITSIVFGVLNPLPVGENGDIAINQLRIRTTPTAVPEPGSALLLAMGASGVVIVARRRARRR